MEISAELELYAMATLKQKDTGSVVMWIRPNLDGVVEQNKEPIIYVRTDNQDTGTGFDAHSVSISISDNPTLIKLQDKSGKSLDKKMEDSVIEFIKQNKESLLQFWRDEIDSEDLRQLIRH
jgi:Ca2+-binding RTX toxin-like protein